VVVKIQRPDVQTMVAADSGSCKDLAIVMEDRFELARRLDAKGILEEFASGVLIELDYRNEAYHMRRLDENMAQIEGVRVPDVDGARSARRVLTMEFIRGVKINDVAAMDAAGSTVTSSPPAAPGDHQADPRRRLLPRRPASRNVLVDTRDGTIVFLDLGLIGQLDRDQRFDLLDLMWSVVQKDAAGISAVMTRMSIQRGKVDPGRVRAASTRLSTSTSSTAARAAGLRLRDLGHSRTLYDNGLKLNQDFTLASRRSVQIEEITAP